MCEITTYLPFIIIRSAKKNVKKEKYHLMKGSCEHWILSGKDPKVPRISMQIEHQDDTYLRISHPNVPRPDFPCMPLRLQTQTVLPGILLPCKIKTNTPPLRKQYMEKDKTIIRNANNVFFNQNLTQQSRLSWNSVPTQYRYQLKKEWCTC